MSTILKWFLAIGFAVAWARSGLGANIYFPIPIDDGSAARAAAEQRAKIGAAFEVKYAIEAHLIHMKKQLSIEPWRDIDGVTNSIFSDGWFHFCGKVTKVMSDGILVDGYICSLTKVDVDHQSFFLVHFPYVVADEDIIDFNKYYMAKSAGTITVPGGAVVHKYDYGKVCAPAPEYIAAMIEQDAKSRRVAESATLKLDQEKAEEGNPMYQYRLGRRYQNGNGVELDRDKARFWLRKAAAQGYEEARTALLNFNEPKADAAPGTNAPAAIR